MNARRANLSSPFARAGKRLRARGQMLLARLAPRTQAVLGLALLVLLTTLILARPMQQALPEKYIEGDIVRRTVVAPTDLTVPNQAETERRQKLARDRQPPIFSYDTQPAETARRTFREAWESLREQKQGNKKLEWKAKGGSYALVQAIAAHSGPDDLERALRILDSVATRYLYQEADAPFLEVTEIILVEARKNAQMRLATPQMSMLSYSTVPERLREQTGQMAGWSGAQQTALVNALAALIQPNVLYNAQATETARENAARNIEVVTVSLKRNQVIAREGDTVTPQILAQFQTLQARSRNNRVWHHIIG